MKLVFVTQVLDPSDAVLGFVGRWVEGLAAHCECVRVLALEEGPGDWPGNVDVRVIGRRGRVARYFRYRRFLSEAFGRDGFDTILTHMVPRYSNLAAGLARRHGAGHFLWYTHKGVDRRLLRAVEQVDKVFTASSESLRVDTPKRVVTGHGIDLRHFDGLSEPPATPLRLLSVGRLTPAKDPLTLLAAFSILIARGHDLHLDLVGAGLTGSDGAFERTVADQIALGGEALAGRIERPGAVGYQDIPAYYRRASLFVSTSLTGSVDKVVLEAMASGRPVVTCNESFPPILAELGPQAALLGFEKGNAEQLAERIESLLELGSEGRRALGTKLRALVQRDHEVDTLMGRLVREMDTTGLRDNS
ncbi:MAG: glycosyltransferase involved in cell wall biosynthesis [Chlamydiales bacterium]|jgi:glycosyltransferase involved in cell wall biosynthesis